jgi:hypothetical protein
MIDVDMLSVSAGPPLLTRLENKLPILVEEIEEEAQWGR